MSRKREQANVVTSVVPAGVYGKNDCFDIRRSSVSTISKHLQGFCKTTAEMIAKIQAKSGAIRKLQAAYTTKREEWDAARAKWWKIHKGKKRLPKKLKVCISDSDGLELADYISWAIKDLMVINTELGRIANDLPNCRNNHEAMCCHASALKVLVTICSDIEKKWDQIGDDYSGKPCWTTNLNIIQRKLVTAGGLCLPLTKVAERFEVIHESLPDSKKPANGRRKPGPGRKRHYQDDQLKRIEGAINSNNGDLKAAATALGIPYSTVKMTHDAARKRRGRLPA
jgi:hypothetical protein